MTREEAIDIIRQYECCNEHIEACEMAIKALDRQKGEWNNMPIGNIKQCSNCGYICTPILADQTQGVYNFCPNCGADTRGDDE